MPNSAALQLSESEPFLFSLLPEFSGDQINLKNTDFFGGSVSGKALQSPYAKYRECQNPFIENEIKGFIQHLVIDCHYAPNTIKGYMDEGIYQITRFVNEWPIETHSIADIAFEEIYNYYLEFLSDNGIKLYYNNIHMVKKDMTIGTYPSKSQYIIAFTKLYRYVYETRFPDTRNEFDKDVWDIRNLGIPYSTPVARCRFTLNFLCIKQEWLRDLAKQYTYYRLQNKTVAASIDDLKALKFFSEFLDERHKEIHSLICINRLVIEEFFAYMSKKGFVATTYNHRISALRTFFIVGNMLGMDGFPEKPLILYSDYRKIVHKLPKYFTDNELTQINQHLYDLPVQIARMLFVLENCGMRLSDICTSEIHPDGKFCLQKNSSDEYTFTYYMPKVHRHNTIPISNIVADIIQESIDCSLKEYGPACRYIFAKTENLPIAVYTFSQQVNRMSLRNNLKRDDGSPLRITGHTFRGTVATQYANCGISMDVIRLMLGQKKIGVLKHYVTIHSDTMITYMQSITDENDMLIKNIGNLGATVQETLDEPSLIPLSNGRCTKSISSGICNHAYACYSCRMFHPLKECLPIYRMQYQEAINNIEIARIHGYDRLYEMNNELKKSLEAIIKKVEDM